MVYSKYTMQNIIKTLKNVQAFSLIMGMAFGAALGLVLFSHMVPNGTQMIGMYHNKIASIQAAKNEKEMAAIYASSSEKTNSTATTQPKPYVMSKITSEKQFLKEMKLHHEAAVIMAQQVLSISTIRPEVRDLAKDIIGAQTTEIKMMKDWIAAWKY